MKNLYWLVTLPFLLVACAPPAEQKAPEAAGYAAKPYANLVQVMRTIPFPNSNIVFDTQSNDPEAKKEKKEGGGATDQYAGLYAGWEGVESAALALSETANLIMIPGRLCSNGKPVPLDQEDFKKWAQGLVEAGQKAYETAKTKDMDKMVDVSGAVSDACLNCHAVYRDVPDVKDRCTPKK